MVYLGYVTHYWHKNIAGPKVSQWKGGYRDFEDEKEMSQHIVKVFNETIKEDDILYFLGDWSFGGKQNIWNFRKQLNCKEIHLILGNHDHNIESNKTFVVPLEETDRYQYLTGKTPIGVGYTQDLFTSVQHYKEISINGHMFILSHYKPAIWNGSHKGAVALYGHSHSTAEDWVIGKSMDVGIDNAKKLLGEYRPFSITEIEELMNKRKIDFKDHHNSSTNVR